MIPYRNQTIFLIILNLAIMAGIIVGRSILPPTVPLFYGKPQGEEQLVPQIFLILPSLVSLAIIAINTLCIKFLVNDPFIKKILFGSTIIATLLSTIALAKIIFLVGSF